MKARTTEGVDTRRVLVEANTLAVVGLSRDPAKTAHSVPASLQASGFRVVPVNPYADEILGEKAYPALADVPVPVDLVVVFRPAHEAADIAQQAVRIGAQALWLQSGIRSEGARRIATDAGLEYVEDRCTAVERSLHRISK